MSGTKGLSLLNESKVIHPRFRYKHLKTAVRRAIDLNIETKKTITIWDTEGGRVIAIIWSQTGKIQVNTDYPRIFNSRWNQ
jgi:hypothetical protein